MKSVYRADLGADLVLDTDGRVRQILHAEKPWLSDSADPLLATTAYLQRIAPVLGIPPEHLLRLRERVSFSEPMDQGIEYRLAEEKRFFDSVTLGFYQTILNLPIWQAGLSVTLDQGPIRILISTNTSEYGVSARLPNRRAIERYQEVLRIANSTDGIDEDPTLPFLQDLLRGSVNVKVGRPSTQRAISSGRFFVYHYDGTARDSAPQPLEPGEEGLRPTLPLAPVPAGIQIGEFYLVAELVFSLPVENWGSLSWRALVEVESNAILYLDALVDGVDGVKGLVFTFDPITSTGDLEKTAALPDKDLDCFRTEIIMANLRDSRQALVGRHVQVIDDPEFPPTFPPPTVTPGGSFAYHVRSWDFAAVNAYYHADQVFSIIEELGFRLTDYFDGTQFPVRVDHVNYDPDDPIGAQCYGNGDGIKAVGYGRGQKDDPPIGRAVDKWVHWHEIGGHGILLDHVHKLNFGFAHSAGDGLAALQNDPESLLRGKEERFLYDAFGGWVKSKERWFNRPVGEGWAWGGLRDRGGLQSEQILTTTHFRVYRSLGGDAVDVASRWSASRVVTYLILRAVSTLTPFTNPTHSLLFCNALRAVDFLKWTTERLIGGAYHKVIRWAFEKQGLFQPPDAPLPPNVKTEGAPPDVDVYIEDGRHGEYPYKPDYWNNPSIWNRHAPDGGTAHQTPIPGRKNYAYVKVKNRGTTAASDVVVRGYYSPPGAGFTWPHDFEQMEPLAGITVPSLKPNHAEEKTVEFFAWTPKREFRGHDGLLIIASVEGDRSNVERLRAGESLEEWRLVPHDNNVGKRNVQLLPGDSHEFRKALHGCVFVAGNPFHKSAAMELRLHLPEFLTTRRWMIRFQGLPSMRFELQEDEKREIVLHLSGGQEFLREDVRQHPDRDISVQLLANGILLGGMTYRLDPDLS